MSENPCDHDFDWVSARIASTPVEQFELLRNDVRVAIALMNQFYDAHETGKQLEHAGDDGPTRFGLYVTRQRIRGRAERDAIAHVQFSLRDDGRIAVEVGMAQGRDRKDVDYTLTTELDQNGDCRYMIDGEEGTFLRWQVVRKMVEPVVFP